MRYTISAPITNSRRWRSSVNLPSPPPMPAIALPLRAMRGLLLDLAAGRFDRGLGTGRGEHALEHELLGQLALDDQLGALGLARHQLGGKQCGEIDLARCKRIELVQHDLGGVVLGLAAETDLRQADVHGHLAAFEAGADLALTRTRERALVAAAAGLAQAGTDTATDALAIFAGALCGL